MKINIRNEQPNDHYQVELTTREAFWNLYCPGCDLHLLLHKIRKHKDFIPELTFVIEMDDKIVGSIFYTKAKIIDKNSVEHEIISFGPVSIFPELHRKGFGRMLIGHSIEMAKKLNYRAIILGGFPYHYHTYGFVGTKKYGISMPDGKYYTNIMALPLHDGALDDISGTIHFSEILQELDSVEVEEFDKKFPHKEKMTAESQDLFVKASSEIDNQDY